ncbi:FRG domain-containing protein [Phocaeicola sp.]
MCAKIELTSKDGFSAINEILNIVKSEYINKDFHFYEYPQLIFRGVTQYYPRDTETLENFRDWTISSGLAVRLGKCYENNYSKADYISTLSELVANAKKNYPEKYKKISDLEILADIQHNGGATCLVDFSKNLLTALWFACQEDSKKAGYLFCYNIMEDMIVNNTLTYIRPEDEQRKIESILTQTYRLTNYCSDVVNRFCLWDPSSINNRIIRQDSVFLFGIEKFLISEHAITTIEISGGIKKEIRDILKSIFNISSTTIYNDVVGYASSNAKLTPLFFDVCEVSKRSYQEGYNNMLKGNYRNAIDYFKQYEGIAQLSREDRIELCFSLAVCYKNVNYPKERYYCDNAILEYQKVVSLSLKTIKEEKKKKAFNEKNVHYYSRKCIRAYNEIIELQYKSGKYSDAIKVCDDIIKHIEREDILIGRTLQTNYCKIAQLELYALDNLKNGSSISNLKIKELADEVMKDSNNSCFDKILIEYYRLVYLIKEDGIGHDGEINELKRKIYSDENAEKKYDQYIDWNFVDIKNVIDGLDNSKLHYRAKEKLQKLTTLLIAGRDLFENQSRRLDKHE